MSPKRDVTELEDLEVRLLLDGVFSHYGYDFRDYAQASLKRRIRKCVTDEGLETVSGLQERVLRDAACMDRLLLALSVNVTAMFRDPRFFVALREKVVPLLRTYPFVRIWDVGCSTGEEVYSLAILLREEGLGERCRVYATDMNDAVLQVAREGIYRASTVDEHARNYQAAGGRAALSDYYTMAYDRVIFPQDLRERMVFAQHNLACDGSFNEFHLILCRNVMIYFNRSLQARVHSLLYESLAPFGVLGLGDKESLRFTPHAHAYEPLDAEQKLFRRLG